MRQNLPVTGNEYLLRDGIQIVSATDVKGIITFCNPDFIEASGRNLLAPLRALPLRIVRVDFAPLAGVLIILFLLHWLPNLLLGHMAQSNLTIWPQ